MDSRRVMRAVRVLVSFLLLAAGGCSYMPYAVQGVVTSFTNPTHDIWFEHKVEIAADDAWRKVVAHCVGRKLSSGYAEGFHCGYCDYVAAGGDGLPPTMPPYCLRCDVLRSPDRQQLIVDYYAGYKHGTDVAKFEGLRDLVVVPLGRPPQPTVGGFKVLKVDKTDPRVPDPYGPSTASPNASTAPSMTPDFVPVPQVPELPSPRRAVDGDVDPNAVNPNAKPAIPAVTPAPKPLVPQPQPLPRSEPDPEPLKTEPLSRLRPLSPMSAPSVGSEQVTPRPLPMGPPELAPVPIAPPPTVVPTFVPPGEESEPRAPSPLRTLNRPAPAAQPEFVPTVTLPELPPLPVSPAAPIVPKAAPFTQTPHRPNHLPGPVAGAATGLPNLRPASDPSDGPVLGTAEGLDDDEEDNQPGEVRGTTSTRDLDSLRPASSGGGR